MISKELTQEIIRVLKPHDPKLIAVFGSYARGEGSPSSDLDVLVHFEASLGLIKLVELQQELSDALGIPVDLVTRNSLKNPRLKEYVLKDVVTIFNEEGQSYIS
jgi:predicted nucleotidyltransferase